MRNFNFIIFCLLLFTICFFTSCKTSKANIESVKQVISEETKDFAFTLFETSLDFAIAKAEGEIKPFFLTLKKDKLPQTYISPLGFVKFEVKRTDIDSLILKISPVWLTITDSCRTKINYHLKNEGELVRLLVNTSLRKAIVKASKVVTPYQIILSKTSLGQFYSPRKFIIVDIAEIDNELKIKIIPNLAEMGEIIKNLFKEAVDIYKQ